MRFMIIRKADEQTEAGVMPSAELLEAMGRYNEELIKAGVMLDGMGLHPSERGARLELTRTTKSVTDGPFAEAKELIAGFSLWEVDSLEHAIELVKGWPPEDGDVEIEIRQVAEVEDFGDAATPQVREDAEKLRTLTDSRGGQA